MEARAAVGFYIDPPIIIKKKKEKLVKQIKINVTLK